MLVGTVISLLTESLHRSRHRTGAIERRRPDPVPRATEDALRKSEERFRGTFENAAVGIAHVDAAGPIPARQRETVRHRRLYAEKSCSQGASRTSTYPKIWRPASIISIALCGEIGRASHWKSDTSARTARSSGWNVIALVLQHRRAGQPAKGIAILQDISERKRLEHELRGPATHGEV